MNNQENKSKYNKGLHNDYINYLLRIFENEDKRLNVIESKISQLINQSGLMISIIAFIIPLFYDKLSTLQLCFKIYLSIVFILTIITIGLSIYFASKIFKIQKYKYADCSTETLKRDFKKKKEFNQEYISDLIYSIDNNKKINDSKGTILLKANVFFTYGIYCLIVLTLSLLVTFFFI